MKGSRHNRTDRRHPNNRPGTRRLPIERLLIPLDWLMLIILLVAMHLGILNSRSPILGPEKFEIGLLPSLTVLLYASWRKRTSGKRLAPGRFATALAVAAGLYLLCFAVFPEWPRRWSITYWNDIQPFITDGDLTITYVFSLELLGLTLAVPQFFFAMFLLVVLPGHPPQVQAAIGPVGATLGDPIDP